MVGISPEPWFTLAVQVAPPQLFGSAEGFERRCVPIVSGSVSGRISGRVLPGGTDWQRVLPGGATELEAHYAIETDAGDTIEVWSRGLRAADPATMRALLAGETVDPAKVYFRSAIRMLTAAPALVAFTDRLFIGAGMREPERVLLAVHAVE